MGGGSSSPPSQTVTQVQDIPAWAQQAGQQNYQLAQSLGSQPYPTYQGQLIAGFTPQQELGMQQTQDAATSYQPAVNAAEGMTAQSTNPWNSAAAMQYMSPYAQSALAPQIQQLGIQQAQQQHQIDAGATQAGAFGDARQGVADSLNNFYGNLAMNDLEQQGMNQAYNTGLGAYQQQQAQELNAANQMGNLGGLEQQLGLTGANANFNAGSQQQQLTQSQLSEAYNNYMNQINWPLQALNMQISALSNTPYTRSNYTSLAPSNATAQNVGAFSALSGALGNLFGGGGNGQNTSGFGVKPTIGG